MKIGDEIRATDVESGWEDLAGFGSVCKGTLEHLAGKPDTVEFNSVVPFDFLGVLSDDVIVLSMDIMSEGV